MMATQSLGRYVDQVDMFFTERSTVTIVPATDGNRRKVADVRCAAPTIAVLSFRRRLPIDVNGTSEVCQANYHLQLSGFLTGQGTISAQHPLGGVVTLNSPGGTGINATFVSPTSVCWHGLPNEAAQQIDLAYDDGKSNTGSMQGSADYTTLNATVPDTSSAAWTCMKN